MLDWRVLKTLLQLVSISGYSPVISIKPGRSKSLIAARLIPILLTLYSPRLRVAGLSLAIEGNDNPIVIAGVIGAGLPRTLVRAPQIADPERQRIGGAECRLSDRQAALAVTAIGYAGLIADIHVFADILESELSGCCLRNEELRGAADEWDKKHVNVAGRVPTGPIIGNDAPAHRERKILATPKNAAALRSHRTGRHHRGDITRGKIGHQIAAISFRRVVGGDFARNERG